MSEQKIDYAPIDLETWVESAKSNPVLYRQRQATEVVLTAIGLSTTLSEALVFKGGTLMAIAFKSDRATGDVDFSATVPPDNFADDLRDELNNAIPQSLKKLGYADFLCQVQKIKKNPRAQNFLELDFPALDVTVGYAEKGSAQQKWFEKGQSSDVVLIEISFRDQVYQFQELHLFDCNVAVKAFTINEIFAEKLRALIQQKSVHRDRYRRQDVFDLTHLLRTSKDRLDAEAIYAILLQKCESRGITPYKETLSDSEIYERAKKQYQTNELEIGYLPDFDKSYEELKNFYLPLPWVD